MEVGDDRIEYNQYNDNNKSPLLFSEVQSMGDFRISTATKPLFYRTNKTIEKLKAPKTPYKPNEPYMHSDFRGLLNADFKEALINCHFYDKNDPNYET